MNTETLRPLSSITDQEKEDTFDYIFSRNITGVTSAEKIIFIESFLNLRPVNRKYRILYENIMDTMTFNDHVQLINRLRSMKFNLLETLAT